MGTQLPIPSPTRGTAAPPSFRPMSVVATVAHLSYCWTLVLLNMLYSDESFQEGLLFHLTSMYTAAITKQKITRKWLILYRYVQEGTGNKDNMKWYSSEYYCSRVITWSDLAQSLHPHSYVACWTVHDCHTCKIFTERQKWQISNTDKQESG